MIYFLLCSFILALIKGEFLLIYTTEAFDICIRQLFPSLFFAMVCIRYLYENHFFDKFHFPILERILHMDHGAITLVYASLFIGVPSNATFIQNAYHKQQISLDGAKRLLYSCGFIAPPFILFTCGIHLLNSFTKGFLLYFAHLFGGFIILYQTRSISIHTHLSIPSKSSYPLKKAILDCLYIIVCISGFLTLCFVTSHLWFDMLPASYSQILQIPIEFTNGIFQITKMPLSSLTKECGILILLCFHGFCLHLQFFSFLEDIHLNYFTFLKYRFLHILYALIIYLILTMLGSYLLHF